MRRPIKEANSTEKEIPLIHLSEQYCESTLSEVSHVILNVFYTLNCQIYTHIII